MAASDRQTVLRRIRSVAGRYQRGKERMELLEAERTSVYREARALEPPITFATLAREFGVTEAAIMQKINRQDDRDAQRKRPRRKPAAPVPSGS